ncbi:MAG TPA: VWA domain-containing protein [Pyrinomonadaceae bacterium]|jgi:VWFA-related protein
MGKLYQHRACRVYTTLMAVAALLVAVPLHVPAQQQQQTASSVAQPVRFLFTIVDKNRQAVTTLRKEDISVSEDEQPQEILNLERQTDQPLSLVILIDTSVSQERTLPNAKLAARAFVDSIMRPGKDRFGISSFTGKTTVVTPLTDDIARVRQAIEDVRFTPPPGYLGMGQVAMPSRKLDKDQMLVGSTSLWDAVWTTSEEALDAPVGTTRRAIVLITDGFDTGSRTKMNEAIDRAIKAETLVFAIAIGDEYYGGVDAQPLRTISERTGARSFAPEKISDLPKIFTEIEQQLQSQYSVTYLPVNRKPNGPLRKIRIEVVNPVLRKEKLRLFHARSYFPKG